MGQSYVKKIQARRNILTKLVHAKSCPFLRSVTSAISEYIGGRKFK